MSALVTAAFGLLVLAGLCLATSPRRGPAAAGVALTALAAGAYAHRVLPQ